MALIDHETPIGRASLDLRFGGRLLSDARRNADTRALAGVGLAALLILPTLLIASLMTKTPVAVPAIIAAGFLLIARAVVAEQAGKARAWTVAVLGGLVIWTVVSVLAGPGATTTGGIVALALVPTFAAAPAFCRRMLGGPEGNLPDPTPGKNAADASAIYDAEPDFAAPAEPDLPIEPRTAFLALHHGPRSSAQPEMAGPVSEAGDAIDFAMRLLGPDLAKRGVTLARAGEDCAPVICERRPLRQIVIHSIDHVVADAPAGTIVSISARKLRGAVLLRIIAEAEPADGWDPASATSAGLDSATNLINDAAGSILCERLAGSGCKVSIRLPLPPARMEAGAGGGWTGEGPGW
jgi:hypothetical protein